MSNFRPIFEISVWKLCGLPELDFLQAEPFEMYNQQFQSAERRLILL